jgi:thioredoxin-like negative regulator of GroEL
MPWHLCRLHFVMNHRHSESVSLVPQQPANARHSSLIWAALCLVTLSGSGCDKIKQLVKSESVVVASQSGPVVRELQEADYPGLIATPGRLTVVVFHATWCGPCKQLAPVLEKVAQEFAGVAQVGRFDVDQCQGLVRQLGIGSIPDVRFFLDGKQVDAFIGGRSESEVREKFQTHTSGLVAAPASDSKTPANAAATKSEPAIQRMPKNWMPTGVERE